MKNLKKLLLTVLVFSAAALSTSALAACGEHEHDWGDWTPVTPATCTETGREERVCKDDPTHVESRVIPAITHNWGEWEQTSAATCTESAVETRVCANDQNHKETRDVGEPLGHDWGGWTVTKPATCTEDGEKVRVCGNDENHKDIKPEYATDHDWDEWKVTTPATCTQKGVETRVCKNDEKHKETRETEVASHTWGNWTQTSAATCTQKAVEERVCSFGVHKETREVGEALNHSWGEWKVTTPATCTEKGVETRVCANDEKHKETREIPAKQHAFGAWTVTTPATCTDKAIETRVCANDGNHKETREVGEPLDHNWGEWKVTTPSTCVTAGVETRVCGNDENHKETRPAALADHSWDEGQITTPATEQTPGEKTFTCTVEGCGETKKEPIPVLGHKHSFSDEWSTDDNNHWKECTGANCTEKEDEAAHIWDEGRVTTPATCTENGVKTYTCTVCEKTKTEPVEKLNHDWSDWTITTVPTEDGEGEAEKVCNREDCDEKDTKVLPVLSDSEYFKTQVEAATCTEDGKDNYKISVDGVQFEFDVAISATGHNPQKTDAKAATCTEAGYEAYWTCSECNKLFSEEACENEILAPVVVNKLPHTLSKTEAKAATCTEKGNIDYWTCGVCGKIFSDENAETEISAAATVIDKLNHSWSEWEQVSAATCTTKAVEERKCGNDASHKETREVGEPLGHDYSDWDITAATADAAGSAVKTCNRNGCEDAVTVVLPTTSADKHFDDIVVADVRGSTFDIKEGSTLISARSATGSSAVYYLGFTAEKAGIYRFEFTHLLTNITALQNVSINNENAAKFATIERVDNSSRKSVISVEIELQPGNLFKLYMNNQLTNGESSYIINAQLKEETEHKLVEGDNLVIITSEEQSGHIATFTSETAKIYSITADAGLNVSIRKDAGDEVIITASDVKQYHNFVVAANETVTFVFTGAENGKYVATIGNQIYDEIAYGENTVKVTTANDSAASSMDVYVFVPEATKKYSLTVPAGLTALVGDKEVNAINEPASVNFEGKADEIIKITFISSHVGEFTVTIGEEIIPVITADAPVTAFIVPAKGVGVIEVGNIEAGKYKLEIGINQTLMRSMAYFGKNINADYDEIYGPASSYGMGGTAEVIFQNMQANAVNGADYNVSYLNLKITIELDLQKGDKLVFAHSNGIDAPINVTITKI